MFNPVNYEHVSSDEKWVSLCAIPLSNPPYQTEYAPKVCDAVIHYEIVYNAQIVDVTHLISYNGTNVTQSISIEPTGSKVPNFVTPKSNTFGYVIDKEAGYIYPAFKATLQYEFVRCWSMSNGVFSKPYSFLNNVSTVNIYGLKQILNFGAATNSATYGVQTIKNVPNEMITSFSENRYFGFLLVGVYTAQNYVRSVPFMVHDGNLYFKDNEITATLDNNIITFTASTSIPLACLTFL